MKERINDKIAEIEEFLDFLMERVPSSLEEYKLNLEKKAICERYAEKIIEALVDLTFLAIKHLNIEIPAEVTDTEIFDLLADKKVITKKISEKLREAKGMRNIIAHEYGVIDDEIVYEAVSSELEKDARDFIKAIKLVLKED